MSLQEVQHFFERYEAAFNALDGDAVADLWHSPSGIAHDHDGVGAVTWWADEAPMRANHLALCDIYRKAGFHRTVGRLVDHHDLGLNQSTALMDWTIERQDGSTLQRFHTHYHLMRGAAGPKVLMCAAYEENIAEMKNHAAE
ncbi:MAG: hypothetical protein C4K60_12080 [Ideonella sp. MAG2]|nr:MAG: hypothetical protein C4K60_12080 [Ideonella sp. MAG2]